MHADIKLPDRNHFSLRELATAADKHISTCTRWSLKGVRGRILPSFLLGGRRYVRRCDVENFLAAINGQPSGDRVNADDLGAVGEMTEAALDAEGL